jgi:hypothetical protein
MNVFENLLTNCIQDNWKSLFPISKRVLNFYSYFFVKLIVVFLHFALVVGDDFAIWLLHIYMGGSITSSAPNASSPREQEGGRHQNVHCPKR